MPQLAREVGGARRAARAPLLTLALLALALLASAWPPLAEAWRFERAALARGELWRLVTGHLVHASLALAVTDLAVLALLGAVWEARERRTYLWILLASALGGSLAVLAGGLELYSGSSALGSGLFAACGTAWLRSSDARARAVGLALLLLLALKIVLELRGSALFVTLPAGTRVAFEAHFAGAFAGVLAVLFAGRRSSTKEETPASRAASPGAG